LGRGAGRGRLMSALEKVSGATPGVWLNSMQVAAFRSLAVSRGIEFADVVDAMADGDLRRIIEMRDMGRERRITEQSVARINALYRSKLLGILQERDALLRERELDRR
jgi:hypothetical protein